MNVARLRFGNWKARAEGSNYWQRQWCEIVDSLPEDVFDVRAWDLAATLPSEINPNPDWTAGVKMGKSKRRCYYIIDVVRFRDRPESKHKLIDAESDGKRTVLSPRPRRCW